MQFTKKRIRRLSIAVAAVLLLFAVPLFAHRPWTYSARRAIDVNSGDVLDRVVVCGMRISEDIHPSAFSEELRRLKIDVSQKRRWMQVDAVVLRGRPISYRYGGTIDKCNLLIKLFDTCQIPDTQRPAILVEALIILQNGDLKQMDGLLDRLGDRIPWGGDPVEGQPSQAD